ncbi:MAG: LON peptidase substrate-binding domain-containing protein [Alphaproteobacteria bacterium]|nr:LON peptidase substrate-binding domain-containing protein [Alphaproteobacteria bacterium]
MKKQSTHYKKLPRVLPLLPLHGAVLLPRAQLPIPIFEFDYLSMVAETVKENNIIGIVQPILKDDSAHDGSYDGTLPLFKSGCAGKIIDITEIDDNHLMVTLKGLCRFEIIQELDAEHGYRRAVVNYDRYNLDMVEEADFSFDRPRLLKALGRYFKILDITPNWLEIDKTSNEKLITALAMVCPFEAREKQALLETPTLTEQSRMITTMIEIAALENPHQSPTCH